MIIKATSIQKKSILAQCMCRAGAGAAATRNTPCAPAPLAPALFGQRHQQCSTLHTQTPKRQPYWICHVYMLLELKGYLVMKIYETYPFNSLSKGNFISLYVNCPKRKWKQCGVAIIVKMERLKVTPRKTAFRYSHFLVSMLSLLVLYYWVSYLLVSTDLDSKYSRLQI